ncbi:hypothetical protein [Streptomyces sp. AcH 505]|uniref:hypothetical protein n=1 Tax=Streptomyces sp. AcH 505 TaxID=352211 RepID=UPI0018E3F34F
MSKRVVNMAAMLPVGAAGIANIAAVAGAGAAAFVSAGAAAAVFGLAVKAQFKSITDASAKYTTATDAQQKADLATAQAKKLAAKGGDAYKAALVKAKSATDAARQAQQLYKMDLDAMPAATRATANALQKFKDTTKNWSDSLAPKTMPLFTKGINLATSILPKLTPLVLVAADAFGDFIDKVAKGASGPGFSSMIKELADAAAKTLPDFLNMIGNVGRGFGNLIGLFLPYAGKFSGGLEGMSKSFLTWTQSLKGSAGFEKFIGFVKQTGPIIVSILKSLGETGAHSMTVFSPYATVILGLGKALAGLLAVIPAEQMQHLYQIVVALAIAQRVWNAYVVVSATVTTAWAAATRGIAAAQRFFATQTIFLRIQLAALWVAQKAVAIWNGILTAAQWAWNAALMASPITWIIIGIVALIAVIVLIATKTTWFQTAWRVTWAALKTAFDVTFNWIKANWPLIVGILGGPIGVAIAYLATKTNFFQTLWATVWGAVKTAALAVWNGFLLPTFNAMMAGLHAIGAAATWLYKNAIHPTWNAISLVIQINWWIIRVIFALVIAGVRGIGSIFSWLYKSAIKPALSAAAVVIKWLWNNEAKPIWNAMKAALRLLGSAFNTLKSGVNSALGSIGSKVKAFGPAQLSLPSPP